MSLSISETHNPKFGPEKKSENFESKAPKFNADAMKTQLEKIHAMEAADKQNQQKNGFKMDSIAFSTWNDNSPEQVIKGGIMSDDSGKTFDLNLESKFHYNERPFTATANLTHYTDGEIVPRTADGKVLFGQIDSSNATRVDNVRLGVSTPIIEKKSADGSYIRVNGGVGLQGTGDFGGGDVQKKWHEANNYYVNNATYENGGKTAFTPDISLSVEGKKYFTGNASKWVYGFGEIGGVMPLDQSIGLAKANVTAGIGANIGRGKIEASHTEAFVDGATGSQTIQWAITDGNHLSYQKIEASAPLGKADIFGAVTRATDKNTAGETGDKGEFGVNVGIKWNF